MKPLVKLGLALAAMMVVSGEGPAQAKYPTDNIRLIAPYTPGGTLDILARRFAISLARELSVNVIVENRPGGGGQVGSQFVAASKPDGSTLLVATTSHVINPSLVAHLPYNTLSDFEPLGLFGSIPSVLIVNSSSPAKSVAEFVSMAKNRPGELTIASSGTGGANHLSAVMFDMHAGVDTIYVPYNGAAEVLSAVMGGHADAGFISASNVSGLVTEGGVRVLATAGSAKLSGLEGVPTMREAGLDFQSEGWYGLFGPDGLPDDVRRLLVETTRKIVESDAEFREFLKSQSLTPGNVFGADFGTFIAGEIDKWKVVVEKAGLAGSQ